MKRFAMYFLSAVMISMTAATSLFSQPNDAMTSNSSTSNRIEWMTNYEDALNKARAASKPIVLFFTGTGWCGWCTKLEQEALSTPDFIGATKDKFVFVKLDFPLNRNSQDPRTQDQNQQLQKKFDVKGFPTIVVIDSRQNQIGVSGYLPGGGKKYADHLLKMVNEFSDYKSQTQRLDDKKASSSIDLKKLYEKAEALNDYTEMRKILALGLHTDQDSFFLIEKYRLLADEGMIHGKDAQETRQKLLASDPSNAKMTHYNVAVIEFEAFSKEMDKEHYSADIAVAPLKDYIAKFGKQDTENLWRIEMLISQVYLNHRQLDQSLKHAQASLNVAPPAIRSDIANAVDHIKKQIATR